MVGDLPVERLPPRSLRSAFDLVQHHPLHIPLVTGDGEQAPTLHVEEFQLPGNPHSAYGARPLKRAIQKLVQNPLALALALLDGRFQDGDTIVADVDAGSRELLFQKEEVGETAVA